MLHGLVRRCGTRCRQLHLHLILGRLRRHARLLEGPRRLARILPHDADIETHGNAARGDKLEPLDIAEVLAELVPPCQRLLDTCIVGRQRNLPLEFRLRTVRTEGHGLRIGDRLLEHGHEGLVRNAIVATVGLDYPRPLQRNPNIIRQTDIHFHKLRILAHAETPEILDNVLPSHQVESGEHRLKLRTRGCLPDTGKTI